MSGKIVDTISETVNELLKGNVVARYEFGDSMEPLLYSGEYCVLVPKQQTTIEVGDAVFCEVDGYYMTHMVMMISNVQGEPMYLIGSPNYNRISNTFPIYGWTKNVYAKALGTQIFKKKE